MNIQVGDLISYEVDNYRCANPSKSTFVGVVTLLAPNNNGAKIFWLHLGALGDLPFQSTPMCWCSNEWLRHKKVEVLGRK